MYESITLRLEKGGLWPERNVQDITGSAEALLNILAKVYSAAARYPAVEHHTCGLDINAKVLETEVRAM